MNLDDALGIVSALAGRGVPSDDRAIEVVLERLDEVEAQLALYRATVTTGGPPPGYHVPGAWQNLQDTPPPESATTGPATPERTTQ